MCAQMNWNWFDKCVGGRTAETYCRVYSVKHDTISNMTAMCVLLFLIIFVQQIHSMY